MPEAEGGISLPSEADLKALPQDERLQQAAEAAKAASSAEGIVNTLKQKAAAITNPAERQRLMTEAWNKEVEARGLSKKARILQSGGFQGAVGGAGIGAATAAGLGTAVGTLVGGVTSIPTTLVGTLVGGGVGMFHGPWIKFGGKDGVKEQVMQVPQTAIDSGAVLVDKMSGSVTVKDPDALKEATAAAEVSAKQQQAEQKERKKPKKLEVRSNGGSGGGDKKQPGVSYSPEEQSKPHPSTGEEKERRKPKKLEVRSNKTSTAA